MDFFIDTKGDNTNLQSDNEDANDLLSSYIKTQHSKTKNNELPHKRFLDKGIHDLNSYIKIKQPAAVKSKVDELMKKSVIHTPEFESLTRLPPIYVSDRKLKEQRRKERSKTTGKDWFNLAAPEITEEVKRDLEVLQMRSVLDPKQFYKKNDMKVLPKYFQIGKVMDSPLDYYNNRLTKKQRKRTLVDELLADAEFKKYNKRKYKEIIEDKRKTEYRQYRKAKKTEQKKDKKNEKKAKN